jgi:outer membrane protein insertion porin family
MRCLQLGFVVAIVLSPFASFAQTAPEPVAPSPAGEAVSASEKKAAEEKEKTLIQAPSTPADGEARGPIVKEIEIEFAGPKSVDKSVIVSNMRTTVGQPYSPAAIQEDVRNLYATGLFVNLRMYDEPSGDGVKVVVIVQPKPLVKEVVITGNDKIKDKAIRKKVTSKVGDPLSEQKVSADAQAVKTYYQDKGFYEAQVEYKIDVNEQLGRAVVTYTIHEGKREFVRDIEFVGVKAFTKKELSKIMKTKTKNWLSFINKSGLYKTEQFDEDKKKIRDFYQDHGYIDMNIEDVEVVSYDEDSLRIKFTIFEGIRYQAGKVDIQGNTLYDTPALLAAIPMKEGDVFSPRGLQDDVKAIQDVYGRDGYIDTEVIPSRQANIERGRMDIVFAIKEGPQSFVEKIVIQGNDRTKDKVLRREMALAPGEVYDTVKIDASKKRLQNLGYFSKVDISPQDTAIPNRKNVVVTVEEQRTGSVTFGVGFSTIDSLLGFVEVTQGNFDIQNPPSFVGGGQKFRTRLQYGLERKDFIVSLTEPWFMNQRLSVGTDFFYNESSYYSSDYDQSRYGGDIRVAKALDQFWTVGATYTLENITIGNVNVEAVPNLVEEEGTRSKSSVRATLTYDTRDDLYLTRKGEKVEFAAEGAGGPILGQTDIYKLELNAAKYWLLPSDIIFSLRGGTGVVDNYGSSDEVPIFDRFFIGGSRTVRGFDYRTVGPRYSYADPITGKIVQTDEPEGGKTMAFGSAEFTYPIFDRVRGAVFADAGIDNQNFFDYSFSDVQVGVGFGFRLDLPIGPLRFDLGFPIVADQFNDGSVVRFHFDAGYQF